MPKYRDAKSKKYGVGSNITIYVKKDTPDFVINWLNEQSQLSSEMLKELGKIISGKYVPISILRNALQTDKPELKADENLKNTNNIPVEKIEEIRNTSDTNDENYRRFNDKLDNKFVPIPEATEEDYERYYAELEENDRESMDDLLINNDTEIVRIDKKNDKDTEYPDDIFERELEDRSLF